MFLFYKPFSTHKINMVFTFAISNITTQSTGSHFLIQITLFFIKKKIKHAKPAAKKKQQKQKNTIKFSSNY
jgi:hypothetical protein